MINSSLTPPTYKRQKFLLAFIKSASSSLSDMDFQKLLFLYHQRASASYYEFVPFLYGCYSFLATQDVDTLCAMGWLEKTNGTIRLLNSHVPSEGNDFFLESFHSEYRNIRGDALVRKVYKEFPYFAINSKIASTLMNSDELTSIQKEKENLRKNEPIVFTIGYEGLSLEKYINMLIQNDVRVLCDVRNNPISRKFGFSKDMLCHSLTKVGIEYVHIPELGIVSNKRKNLAEKADYESLFSEYRKQLPSKKKFIDSLYSLFTEKKRIALTCFEHDPAFCHRHVLSDYLAPKYNLKVVHL